MTPSVCTNYFAWRCRDAQRGPVLKEFFLTVNEAASGWQALTSRARSRDAYRLSLMVCKQATAYKDKEYSSSLPHSSDSELHGTARR